MKWGIDGRPHLSSDFNSEESHNQEQENEELKKFKKGDRVRVGNFKSAIKYRLQRDNRVGTVVRFNSDNHFNIYWLQMDKPVKKEGEEKHRPSTILKGYAYVAYPYELELLEPASEPRDSFDIDEWRKNLKPGDKVGISKTIGGNQLGKWEEWRGRVVTLKRKLKKSDEYGYLWKIRENKEDKWSSYWFEPVEKSTTSSATGQTGQGESRKTKEPQKQPPDPRLKNLIQTALELTRVTETTFKDSKKYPIFGINLAKQEAEEKIRKSNLGESLLSLGVVLYHLYTGESEHNNHSYLLDGYPKPEDMPEGFWKVVNKLLKSEYKSLDEFKEDLKNLKDGG